MVRARSSLLLSLGLAALVGFLAGPAHAVPGRDDSLDTSDPAAVGESDSFDSLLDEAEDLILQKRPIDARAKLQKALQLNPTDYRPHMLLGQYYLFDVGHFTLAYRYIRTAEDRFLEQFGEPDGSVGASQSRAHAMLLYLRAEAELNLDKYEDSLKTLDRFGALYSTDWYPGTRAWVLMKLKRIDEAIMVAQSALIDPLRRADPRRTYNILGILLSVKGNRELSLKAFQQAIAAEISLGSMGQVATPLNNAGEVYRELFKDDLAEASWLRATRLPDGCEHILPSLNLAILYIDQQRFFQAERALSDFEACFAQQGERSDTEHRALLALARGRIALRTGDVDTAVADLTLATERQQWFGKIGTNEDDVRFASTIAMAQALEAQAAALHDTAREHWYEKALDMSRVPMLRTRAWWLYRQARRQGVDELSDLEDLFIRNTDTMVEYPTLGSVFRGFPVRSFRKRIERMIRTDDRPRAHTYYRLYLAENLLANGERDEARALLMRAIGELRPIDRLAKAQAISDLLVLDEDDRSFFFSQSADEKLKDLKLREELFQLLPSQLRYADLALPVRTSMSGDASELSTLESTLRVRFSESDEEIRTSCRYELRLRSLPSPVGIQLSAELVDTVSGALKASQTATLKSDGTGVAELANKFIATAFRHTVDPAGEAVPKLDLLEGIMER